MITQLSIDIINQLFRTAFLLLEVTHPRMDFFLCNIVQYYLYYENRRGTRISLKVK